MLPIALCQDAVICECLLFSDCNVSDAVMEIIYDPGRGVLLVKVVFRDTDKLKLKNVPLMTVGGT